MNCWKITWDTLIMRSTWPMCGPKQKQILEVRSFELHCFTTGWYDCAVNQILQFDTMFLPNNEAVSFEQAYARFYCARAVLPFKLIYQLGHHGKMFIFVMRTNIFWVKVSHKYLIFNTKSLLACLMQRDKDLSDSIEKYLKPWRKKNVCVMILWTFWLETRFVGQNLQPRQPCAVSIGSIFEWVYVSYSLPAIQLLITLFLSGWSSNKFW